MQGDRECGLCQAVVTKEHVRAGKVALFRSVLYCPRCAGTVERLRRETLQFASRFDRALAYFCAACESPIGAANIAAGKALRYSEGLFCSRCSEDVKVVLGRAEATQPAADEGVAICGACAAVISRSERNSGEIFVLEGETYCRGCRKDVEEIVSHSQSRNPDAQAKKTAPPDELLPEPKMTKKASKKKASEKKSSEKKTAAKGKLSPEKCPICKSPTDGSTAGFAERTYCSKCSGELATVLGRARMRAGAIQNCTGCGRVASGAHALVFHLANLAYCKDCIPKAQPIVESMVKDGIARRRSKTPFAAVAAVLFVAVVGGGFGVLRASEPARPAPAVEAPRREATAIDPSGPARALLEALGKDLARTVSSAASLADAPLSVEDERLRVVTVAALPGGGTARALIEYSVADGRFERRMLRWLDSAGAVYERNAPLAVADGVVSFHVERAEHVLHVSLVFEGSGGKQVTETRELPLP